MEEQTESYMSHTWGERPDSGLLMIQDVQNSLLCRLGVKDNADSVGATVGTQMLLSPEMRVLGVQGHSQDPGDSQRKFHNISISGQELISASSLALGQGW